MDATIAAALIVAGGGAFGALTGHLAGRKTRNAQVELTETQRESLQAQVYSQLVDTLQEERAELERKVTALKDEVAQLRARLEHLLQREQELRRDLETTRDERDAARAEVLEVRTQLATARAELDAARADIEHLRSAVVSQAQQIPPAV